MAAARTISSTPTPQFGCPGVSMAMAANTGVASRISDCPARRGMRGSDRMRSRLIETATNSSPVSAAPAPAMPTAKSVHASISSGYTRALCPA